MTNALLPCAFCQPSWSLNQQLPLVLPFSHNDYESYGSQLLLHDIDHIKLKVTGVAKQASVFQSHALIPLLVSTLPYSTRAYTVTLIAVKAMIGHESVTALRQAD